MQKLGSIKKDEENNKDCNSNDRYQISPSFMTKQGGGVRMAKMGNKK